MSMNFYDVRKVVGADFDKWRRMDLWQLRESICLLLSMEPALPIFVHRNRCGHESLEFWNQFDEIAKMAECSINLDDLKPFRHFPDYLFSELFPSDFLKWAKSKGYEIPDPLGSLLASENSNKRQSSKKNNLQDNEGRTVLQEDKIRHSRLAKERCQAIALTLWDIDPKMTIEDMKKHHAIQEYGLAKFYKGKNTVREWLQPIDPRPLKAKTGRPRAKR